MEEANTNKKYFGIIFFIIAIFLLLGGIVAYYFLFPNTVAWVNEYGGKVSEVQVKNEPAKEDFVIVEKTQTENKSAPPASFQSFDYESIQGKIISISGTCSDKYYALLVFKENDDYRKDPAKAFFNKAYPCPPAASFSATVDLRDFNLPSGRYYLFVADEGERGSWYNPR